MGIVKDLNKDIIIGGLANGASTLTRGKPITEGMIGDIALGAGLRAARNFVTDDHNSNDRSTNDSDDYAPNISTTRRKIKYAYDGSELKDYSPSTDNELYHDGTEYYDEESNSFYPNFYWDKHINRWRCAGFLTGYWDNRDKDRIILDPDDLDRIDRYFQSKLHIHRQDAELLLIKKYKNTSDDK